MISSPKEALWTKDFILATAINLFLFLSFQMFPAALPPYMKSLGASDGILGWITGIAMISTLMTRPLAGIALDTLGRRGMTLAGLAIILLATLALYFFPVVGIVLLLRFIHGLGWGIGSTATNTVAADYIPKSRMGEGMGYFSLSASVAMAVAPAIALSLASGPMILTGTAFSAISLGLAFFLHYRPLEKAPAARAARPRLKLSTLYEKSSFVPSFIMAMVTITYGMVVTFLAIYAAEKGVSNIGPYFTVYAIVMLLTRPTVGKIVDKRGFGIAVLPGVLLIAIALILLSQASSLLGFLVCAVFYGVGQGAAHTSLQAMAMLQAPPGRLGAANATYFTGFDGGLGFGAVAAGVLAGYVGYAHAFLLMSVFPLLGGALYLATTRKRKKDGEKAS